MKGDNALRTDCAYVSYNEYYLSYDTKDFTFTAGFAGQCIKAEIICDFCFDDCDVTYSLENTAFEKRVCYTKGDKALTLIFRADNDGISVKSVPEVGIKAKFCFADTKDLLAMRTEKRSAVLNCSLGNAVSKGDNMLFDKNTDSAAVIESDCAYIGFDCEENVYTLSGRADFKFSFHRDIYANKYHIPYGRLNKNNTFGTRPPVGWMSWYAVKFKASEKTVLENAAFQSRYLKDFGANAIWIDWEWYHKGFYVVSDWVHKEFYEENPRDDGVDTFHPDRKKYPNGIKYVSDKIKELGLIPSLWIGFTHETWETDYIKEHPEIVLAKEPTWVGMYFYDITHPVFLNDYLPKALSQVKEWGYGAVKFDTLPICMEMTEKYHDRLYDKSLTTYRAYRNMIAKTREILGNGMYMLSCSGDNGSDILWGADIFDGARIGLDIFKWDEFIKNCVLRTMEFYPLHNIMLYNDADNVVVREEFNSMNQAISRAVFVSMLGMPVTFGDNLSDLPKERVDILKRVIPPLDISPKDIFARVDCPDVLVTNLCISQSRETYSVASVFNTTEESRTYFLDFKNDLELCGKEYHVYDFWHDEYLGRVKDGISVSLEPCETRVFAVRENKNIPQIVSTSRHITQGAAEITEMKYDDNTLRLKANLVKNDEYRIALYIPEGFSIADSDVFEAESRDIAYLTFMPDETKEYEFKIKFNQ